MIASEEKIKVLSPSLDIVFKTMWIKGDKDVKRYLERMVEYSIGRELGEYTLGSNETGVLNIKTIANKYDILLVNNKVRSRVNVEMNRSVIGKSGRKRIDNRNLTYLGHVLVDFYNGIEEEKRYTEDVIVEQVNFNCYYAEEKIFHRLDFEFVDKNHEVSRKGVKLHQLYLPRMKELCYTEEEDIYKDFTMLISESYEEMEELARGNKEREAVVKFLKMLESDGEYMDYVDEAWNRIAEIAAREDLEDMRKEREREIREVRAEGFEQGRSEGITEGRNEGITEGIIASKIEIVKEMKKANYSLEEIRKITKLTEEEINQM